MLLGCILPVGWDCSQTELGYHADHPPPSDQTHSSTLHPYQPPPVDLRKVDAINTIEYQPAAAGDTRSLSACNTRGWKVIRPFLPEQVIRG